MAVEELAGSRSRMDESATITWLVRHVQDSGSIPSLVEVSRKAGVARRQLHHDRWPKFRDTYDKLSGLQRGVDKARLAR